MAEDDFGSLKSELKVRTYKIIWYWRELFIVISFFEERETIEKVNFFFFFLSK